MSGTIRRGKAIRGDLALWDGKTSTYSRVDATGGTITGLAVGNEVDVLQVFGDGTSRTRSTIRSATNHIGSTVVILNFAPGTWTIDDDLTIPSNFVSRVPEGCVFNVSAGKTLTFSGPVIQEGVTSTSGSGSAVGIDGNGVRGAYYKKLSSESTVVDYRYPPGHVRRYGVTLDGTTNDASALQTCIDLCESAGIPIIGDAGTALVSSTITIESVIGDLSMMTVSAASASVNPVLRVGVATGGPTTINGRLRLPKVTNSSYVVGSGWSGFGTGINLANLYQSDIFIPQVTGFDIGVDAGGYDEGFVHNEVTIVMLQNNKRGLRIGGKASTGWANQNTFRVQRCFINSSEGSAVSGVRHILFAPFSVASDDVSWPNGNTVIGASVEGDVPEYLVELAGNNNLLVNHRFESSAKAVKLTGHASATKTFENSIFGGYDSAGIVFTTSGVVVANGVFNPRRTSLISDDAVMNLQNVGGSALPLLQGFDASAGNTLGKTSAATDWNINLTANFLRGKARTDSSARVELDFINAVITLLNLVTIQAGAGTPEGSVTANGGSIFLRTNGGASTTLYVKESGTGNTGWVAK